MIYDLGFRTWGEREDVSSPFDGSSARRVRQVIYHFQNTHGKRAGPSREFMFVHAPMLLSKS
jgi:hypothetical protein